MADSSLRVLLDEEQIDAVVRRLAAELSERHDDGVVLAAVLRGSVPFLSDLVRRMTVRSVIDFLAITSYEPNSGRVRFLKDLDVDVTDRDVVVIEDIVDTGQTTAFIVGEIERRSPRSVSVCALVDRPARRKVPVQLDHVGIEIPDEYVIGYGLDHDGRYRNARVLAAADPEVLAGDADAYVSELYPA